jgi:hypothetical protein
MSVESEVVWLRLMVQINREQLIIGQATEKGRAG